MQEEKYVVGLDYGTLSARAVLVSVSDGRVIEESVYPYPHGILDTVSGLTSDGTGFLSADYALQEIDDYIDAMFHTIREVVENAGCQAEDVIGIGIDATSSTFLPLLENKPPGPGRPAAGRTAPPPGRTAAV